MRGARLCNKEYLSLLLGAELSVGSRALSSVPPEPSERSHSAVLLEAS